MARFLEYFINKESKPGVKSETGLLQKKKKRSEIGLKRRARTWRSCPMMKEKKMSMTWTLMKV